MTSLEENDCKPPSPSSSSSSQAKIGYVCSSRLIEQLDRIPRISGRARLVNSLINSYDLFDKLRVIAANPCEPKQLQTFHSSAYLEYLQECSTSSNNNNNNSSGSSNPYSDDESAGSNDDNDKSNASYYGLDHDCPVVEDLYEMCRLIAGASLAGADMLVSGECRTVVNWLGGWHHAKRERASGYCYVNDCVLAILRLRRQFERVLYIDLDLHHGDGVQEAFEYTNKVVTLSFHKHSPGFFPGTGALTDIGKGPGLYHTVNVPLLAGLDDQTLSALFARIFTKLVDVYQPGAIVCQCGADGLYGDPIDTPEASFNLTLDGYLACVRRVAEARLPTLFLGGGGYNLANTARLWTSILGQLVDVPDEQLLDSDIPDRDPFFLQYAPSYEMRVEPGLARNKNTPEYTQKILDTVLNNLDMIKI